MDGLLALRLFQNDYITSFKFKNLIFFCSNFEYYFEWLVPKAICDKSGGTEKPCSHQGVSERTKHIKNFYSSTAFFSKVELPRVQFSF